VNFGFDEFNEEDTSLQLNFAEDGDINQELRLALDPNGVTLGPYLVQEEAEEEKMEEEDEQRLLESVTPCCLDPDQFPYVQNREGNYPLLLFEIAC
jgi:hypothetical protein